MNKNLSSTLARALLSTCLVAFGVLGTSSAWAFSQADLDGDGRVECLKLNAGQAALLPPGCLAGTDPLWQSPPGWQVKQAAFTDLNQDGQTELALLVWRPFQPWPVDRYRQALSRIAGFHNSAGKSCHIILIGYTHLGYKELWAGSALARPVRSFSPVDQNGDGFQELSAWESDYADPSFFPPRARAFWEWNGFGFSLIQREKIY